MIIIFTEKVRPQHYVHSSVCQGQYCTVCTCASCLLHAAYTAYRLPPTICCLPLTARRLPPTAYTPTTYRMPPTACHLPPAACLSMRMPPVLHTYRLHSTYASMSPFLRSRSVRDGRARRERTSGAAAHNHTTPSVGEALRTRRMVRPSLASLTRLCEQRPGARSRSRLVLHLSGPPCHRHRGPAFRGRRRGRPALCQHPFVGCCQRPCDRGRHACRRGCLALLTADWGVVWSK